MIDKKIFKKAFSAPFDKAGFLKKGQSWFFDGADSIIVVTLEKCDWDELYYVDVGFWLKELGQALFPLYYHCHIYERLEFLFPEKRELILTSCDLEKSDADLLIDLSEFILEDVIPFLKGCTNIKKLSELFNMGVFRNSYINFLARKYLSNT